VKSLGWFTLAMYLTTKGWIYSPFRNPGESQDPLPETKARIPVFALNNELKTPSFF